MNSGSLNLKVETQRTAQGWAATESSGFLKPYSYVLRNTGPEDVFLKIICCGICHSDLHFVKDDLGFSNYPIVPGHEIVGKVIEVGSEVRKVNVGEYVGVGYIIESCNNCKSCNSDNEHYCDKRIAIYNDKHTDGTPTHGGFANAILVHQRFVVKIPNGMTPEQAAPLMCAGITAYSPLIRFGLNKPGLRGAILGLGGVGHMAVMIAKAMGHHVTVISSSDKKRDEALGYLGADKYFLSSDTDYMLEAANSLDYILDTLPVLHPLDAYMTLLKSQGKLIVLGAVNVPLQFSSVALLLRGITIAGSFIGSMKEIEELMNFFQEKGLGSKIEVIQMDYVNSAFERLQKNDVRYKFVIDVAGSTLDS